MRLTELFATQRNPSLGNLQMELISPAMKTRTHAIAPFSRAASIGQLFGAMRAALLIYLAGMACEIAGAASAAPEFVRIITQNNTTQVGELVKEDERQIEFLDYDSGEIKATAKAFTRSFQRQITESEVIRRVGLPKYVARRIQRVLPTKPASGKIASIDASLLFVTLGKEQGIVPGQVLEVLREDGEIRDPDTGTVLGKKRRKLADLEVISIEDKFCKARVSGESEAKLLEGDLIEQKIKSNAIAVLPFWGADEAVTPGGRTASENLTDELTKLGTLVVANARVRQALQDLQGSQASIADLSVARRTGKTAGAAAVLIGTVSGGANPAILSLRLVKVESGEILFAITGDGGGTSPGSLAVLAPQKQTPVALVPPAKSSARGVIPVVRYEMRNGEPKNMDIGYTGEGARQAGGQLKGGKGLLTNGSPGVSPWSFPEGNPAFKQWVGWQRFSPAVRFVFEREVNLERIVVVSTAHKAAGVGVFSRVDIKPNNGPQTSFLVDTSKFQNTGVFQIEIPVGAKCSEIELSFTKSSEWLFLSEVTFFGSR